MRTLQPKNRLKGGNGHDRKTPHRVEKGNGEPLAASPPARRQKPRTAVLHGGGPAAGRGHGDPRRARAEIQREKEKKIIHQETWKTKRLLWLRKLLSRSLLVAGGKHRGSITARSFCSSPLPQASAADGDRIRGQMELGCTRSGRSPEVCLAPACDGPRPRRGNSPHAAPGALQHLCAAHARKRNRNQDRLSLKYGSGSAPSFWVRLEEQHGLCGELTRKAHRDIRGRKPV